VALGSRILGVGALRGGMPRYKYLSNRVLTCIQNWLVSYKLSEYHTGYRAFSRRILETLPLEENSEDFVFDNEMLAQAIYFGFHIAEITCPTSYGPDASSISFRRSVRYGLAVLWTSLRFRLERWGLARFAFLDPRGQKLAGRKPAEVKVQAMVEVPASSAVGSQPPRLAPVLAGGREAEAADAKEREAELIEV
jgi:hypothetical protein